MNGLTQIRIYGQKLRIMKEISQSLNAITRSAIAFEMTMRGFAVTTYFIVLLLFVSAMIMGINHLKAEQGGLYGITVFYLMNCGNNLQFVLRQIISAEGIMVSA